MALNTRVAVSGQDRENPFNIAARATGLIRHGAAIQLNKRLPVGSTLVVRNGRGTQAPVRIVAQIQINAAKGTHTYGVEFLEEGAGQDFWGHLPDSKLSAQ
jgi:hypothetical protein